MGKKQQLGSKKIRRCAAIVGKPVISACINGGDLPHNTAIAWTGAKSAYIVNLKKGTALEYVRDGKFIIKRIRLPFRVRLAKLKNKQAFIAIGEPQYHNPEAKDDSDYYVKLMDDTNAAIERMRKRFAPKTEETLYQKYIRSAEQLKQEIRDDLRANSYRDIT